MKVFNAEQIRRWDQYTIEQEPVASVELMERAALACAAWLNEHYPDQPLTVFCGKGNNGGDGLAIARLLSTRRITVYILEFGHKGTEDFQTNLSRLHQYPAIDIRFIQTEENLHPIVFSGVIIDALFGSGLNRGLEGVTAALVQKINESGCPVVSIDLPSGMFVDRSSAGNVQVAATHTLSFQIYKPAFLAAENAAYCGDVHILDIGLHQDFYDKEPAQYELTDETIIHRLYKHRNRFSHKGNFGHALMIAGSYGKIGAAVLSTEACLRTGAGLVSCHIPRCGYEIMQARLPEAMVSTDLNHSINTHIDVEWGVYQAIGIGPGLGTAAETRTLLKEVFDVYKRPVVLDADALNSIAKEPGLLEQIPPGSILSPHPKEFQRLFGETVNEFERLQLASLKAKELKLVIILKGHHTLIALPDGKMFFNSTGNAGMATGGSGDVLTGILTSLLAQGYQPGDAAVFGVYLHGLAGDLAARELSMEAMIAGDITRYLGKAFLAITEL